MTYILETFVNSMDEESYCMKSTDLDYEEILEMDRRNWGFININGCEGRMSKPKETKEQFLIRMALSGYVPKMGSIIYDEFGKNSGMKSKLIDLESGRELWKPKVKVNSMPS